MRGIDTNVLVRYIVEDDAAQGALAVAFLESLDEDSPGHISVVVLAELVWVLTKAYGLKRSDVAETLKDLLQLRELVVERADCVSRAIQVYSQGNADFADCLIAALNLAAGCNTTVTFDRHAARSAGMTLLPLA